MKVLMTGGGTGGHVNPGIAIADKIKEQNPDCEIAFVGTSHGIETKLVPASGYKLYTIDVQGIHRSLSIENIKAFWLSFTSIFKAKRLLKRFKPDLVVGTGGYACWPIMKAAIDKKIPSALHESNAYPGMVVKMLQNKVDLMLINFEETKKYLNRTAGVVHVGNPLKHQFGHLTKEEARAQLNIDSKYKKILLSYGGSMGAERVNEEVIKLMRDYSSKHPEILHIHASGSIEWEASNNLFDEYGLRECPNLILKEYIYDMPIEMAAADLVICRAGAMTLSEIAAFGKPSILIPSPHVAENHQYKNACVLSDAGAAVCFEEKDLCGDVLDKCVEKLLSDDALLDDMAAKVSNFAVFDADDRIYRELEKIAKK